MIFQMIYTCALHPDVTCQDLKAIAQTSRLRNSARGITGLLLCKDGSALQVLEGDRKIVETLYETIENDIRVSNALVLIRRMTEKREFPRWSMGFKNASESNAAFELCAQSFAGALPSEASPELNTISQTFARVNGLVA